ncbi:hypothetical protein [Noviherbaspirillum sp. UKPF54]|uniref:hypothetical protein n=1 Tax=Noviherbaspirillum sp. UKPF54 TaxID=2601898 RepID=UPI0011B156E5|nr:hypothetical protein [Noviherbaspirillum sp. UKPF54]QDZ29767.1 hypothetical protein FAY22_18435 [Noviherbaspirillum sp. UKPF54]
MRNTSARNTIFHTLAVAGAILAASMSAGPAAAQTTTFAASYNGAGVLGGSCGSTYNISGVEPSATGTYPVFIYMVGTSESYNNAAAMAAVNDMASKGYVAATVDYATSQFGNCSVLSSKSSCIFSPNSSVSAVSQLCSRAKADCSKGIVVAGFSQGSVLALLAKNYDARVQAAYGMGMSNVYSTYDLSSCVSNGNRTLQSDRLRAVDGERDNFAGGSQSAVQSSLQNVTGVTCKSGSYSCLTSNNSGWIIVKNTQVQDGSADHCYMRKSGDCLGSQSSLDSGWQSGTASWEMDPNLQWLTNFTTK